jgi:outer membrane protein W
VKIFLFILQLCLLNTISAQNFSSDEGIFAGSGIGIVEANEDIVLGSNIYLYTDLKFSYPFSLRFSLGRIGSLSQNNAIPYGRVSSVYSELLLNLLYKNNPLFEPYIGYGVGYFINSFSIDKDYARNLKKNEAKKITTDIKNDIAFIIAAGLNLKLSQDYYLDILLKYILLEPDTKTIIYENNIAVLQNSSRISFKSLYFSLGFHVPL